MQEIGRDCIPDDLFVCQLVHLVATQVNIRTRG